MCKGHLIYFFGCASVCHALWACQSPLLDTCCTVNTVAACTPGSVGVRLLHANRLPRRQNIQHNPWLGAKTLNWTHKAATFAVRSADNAPHLHIKEPMNIKPYPPKPAAHDAQQPRRQRLQAASAQGTGVTEKVASLKCHMHFAVRVLMSTGLVPERGSHHKEMIHRGASSLRHTYTRTDRPHKLPGTGGNAPQAVESTALLH